MKKRLLAWLLSLTLILGLLPVSAMAADPEPLPLDDGDSQMQVEQSTVTVDYKDAARSQATITYHKEGIEADSFNLIFLVDTSRQGARSNMAFGQMMFDSGLSYIYDYLAGSTVQLINYQYGIMKDTGMLTSKTDLNHELVNQTNPGEGTANEPAALEAAIQAVKDAHRRNGNPTVVFWVLGGAFGAKDTSAIEEKLKELNSELKTGTDALITWQYAAQPNKLLTQYATDAPPVKNCVFHKV